jgi:hypothetical protein
MILVYAILSVYRTMHNVNLGSGQQVGERPLPAASIGGHCVRSGIIRPQQSGDYRHPGQNQVQYADGGK